MAVYMKHYTEYMVMDYVSFSHIDNEALEEKFVGVPDGGDLVGAQRDWGGAVNTCSTPVLGRLAGRNAF